MARVFDNLFTEGTKGAVGKKIVYKQVNGKTIMSKYPDMSQVQYNKKQKKYQDVFAEGVKVATAINNDPVLSKEWQKKIANNKSERGTSVFHAVLKEYLKANSEKVPKYAAKELLEKCLAVCTVSERQKKALKHIISQHELTNAIYQRLNNVSKPTATRDLQDMVKKGLIATTSRGAGAVYKLLIKLDKEPG